MKHIKNMLLLSLFFVFCFGKTNNYKVNSDIEIIVNDERPILIESSSNINIPQSREEIDGNDDKMYIRFLSIPSISM